MTWFHLSYMSDRIIIISLCIWPNYVSTALKVLTHKSITKGMQLNFLNNIVFTLPQSVPKNSKLIDFASFSLKTMFKPHVKSTVQFVVGIFGKKNIKHTFLKKNISLLYNTYNKIYRISYC